MVVEHCAGIGRFNHESARADEWNKETRIQISEPLEIPGQTLKAGKYVFKLADDAADRNIVEVFSEDANGNQNLVTTILAIPAYRENTPEKPIFDLEERRAGNLSCPKILSECHAGFFSSQYS
jgi:hypothetical protein